jgi:hypothetical protein
MINDPSYQSFLLRLWHESGFDAAPLRAEVEHIQSGMVAEVCSLEDAFRLIRKAAGDDEEGQGAGKKQPATSRVRISVIASILRLVARLARRRA